MDDPEDSRFTLSFDLLYKGLEVTTGGQRIHDYQMLLGKIESRGMTTEGLETYLRHSAAVCLPMAGWGSALSG